MLKAALNAVTKIHSRPATLKRLGSPDLFSPCRLSPSNYYKARGGPEYTAIKGVEFVIPIDTITGQFAQRLEFSEVPDAGVFRISFGANTTQDLDFDATAADIQAALRLLAPLANVVVSGNFVTGFKITFAGFQTEPGLGTIGSSTLTEGGNAITFEWTKARSFWMQPLIVGDRIIDGSKVWTVKEVEEMHDLGAQVMAFRVRAE